MPAANPLQDFIERHARLFVLTGAGCSTESGIPDYRDEDGAWKGAQPVQFKAFMEQLPVRQRYWARSMIGWRHFSAAQPNATHRALARLEAQGRIHLLVTQNVDGLHSEAGSERVIDLHGRLATVRCMACAHTLERAQFQLELTRRNPAFAPLDANVDVPPCPRCGGILKPDVVFYGEPVPGERVEAAFAGVAHSDAMLIVGSSLMVYSGYRFATAAAAAGKPLAAVNLGRTRADELLSLKVSDHCSHAFSFLD